MPPRTRQPDDTKSRTATIDPTVLFAAFSNERRQDALEYLAGKPAAIPIGDLAEYIVLVEGRSSYEWYERVLTDLAHNHLPQLTDAGLVAFDPGTELVELAVERRVIEPYLRLAQTDDR